jgi:hypothetical protein
VDSSLHAAHRAGAWLNLIGWLELAAVALGALWLARRFHRLVNVPLAAAAIVLLVMLFVGGAKQASSVSDADDAVTGVLTTADRAAQARAAGFDARSQEALTLINRGNGQANEARWKQASATVDAIFESCAACRSAEPDFAAYQQSHIDLRARDDAGDWDAAVDMSLGRSGDLSTQFDDFDTKMQKVIDTNSASADRSLDDAGSSLGALRIITLLVGLVVAVLGAIGFGQRLREYR